MPRIDRILTLDHPGPLRRFAWPADPVNLPNFRRYNLIYGFNGSGKTSMSRLLRGIETKQMPSGCSLEVEVDGQRLHSDPSRTNALPIRVFNAEFVASNVISAGPDGVPPIFVFGEHSVNLQDEVNRLKETVDALQVQRTATEQELNVAERDLDALCRRQARRIKQQLRSAGQNPYNNYDKRHYKRTADRLSAQPDAMDSRLTDQERQSLTRQCLSLPKPAIEISAAKIPGIAATADSVNRILRTSVVSTVIRELETDPRVASWVFAGLELHLAREAELCLFCGEELSHERLDRLDAHFSKAYVELNSSIDRTIESLDGDLHGLRSITLPAQEAFYDSIVEDAENAIGWCVDEINRCRGILNSLLDIVRGKKERMFESYEAEVDLAASLPASIAALSSVIARHNETTAEFDRQTGEARERLEEDVVSEDLARYRRLQGSAKKACDSQREIESELKRIGAEVIAKEQAILEHRRPAAELNRELNQYLGHDEVQFSVKETGYEITRSGVAAKSLSEGEKTAISLLYFLKSLQSREFELSEGIVVLDDPVSSLDANALYAACGFIRERTRGAGQVFVLTHNFSFFREIRRWMSSSSLSESSSFYMLDTGVEDGVRSSRLRELDPLLRDYESDYHYLFSRIYWHANDRETAALGDNYAMPNMARRLLERFFAFCRPQKPGPSTLESQLQSADVPVAVRSRIVRFTHAHSHADSIDEVEHDPNVLGEAKDVLREILSVMKQEAPSHYSQMVRLATQART